MDSDGMFGSFIAIVFPIYAEPGSGFRVVAST
jgi:hypothetical protein